MGKRGVSVYTPVQHGGQVSRLSCPWKSQLTALALFSQRDDRDIDRYVGG